MATLPIRKIPSQKTYATATVTTEADGLSDVIDLGGHTLSSIQNSTAGWTTADLTFMGSVSSTGNMQSVRVTTAATELTYVTTASFLHVFDPLQFSGIRYLQLRSGTTATPVAQVAARSVILGLASLSEGG